MTPSLSPPRPMGIKHTPDLLVREEAAAVFANGEILRAAQMLLQHVTQNQAQASPRAWYMLLDLYQVTGDRERFEATCSSFLTSLGYSPPPWSPPPAASVPPATLAVTGPVTSVSAERLAGFLVEACSRGSARLDLSRAQWTPDAAGVDSVESLLSLMARLRRRRVKVDLMGDHELDRMAGLDPFALSSDAFWRARMELAQWHGDLEAFEALAVKYAQGFGLSPPAWDMDAVMDRSRTADAQTQALRPPPVVDDAAAVRLAQEMRQCLEERARVQVDMSNVLRMTYSAAIRLVGHLGQMQASPAQVTLAGPNELVAVLLECAGLPGYASILGKKR